MKGSDLMQQIISDEEQTWESILYDRSYGPFPYKIFKDFDESFIHGLPYLSDDFIQKILIERT